MSFRSFSQKQKQVLTWWLPGDANYEKEAIVCDGAVRSGKTMAMGLSFFLWAMTVFDGQRFGICGKTIASLRRNVLGEILPKLAQLGAVFREKRTENLLIMELFGHENSFYIFGGRDESSASLIQGITFAGVLLDEVALMPRSFVEQACARCSVAGSRLWFNCNPEGPGHWFYKTWILEAEKRNCLRLHFTMADNPSLSPAIRKRYETLYTGVFYRRFVLGQWVKAKGRVYDFFQPEMVGIPPKNCEKWCISCDYGTVNPTSMGLWGRKDGVWYRTG
jgi:PBSX family phage terminase large subunit